MNDNDEYIRSDNTIFHAVVLDLGATWARATEPFTAIRNAANSHTSRLGTGLPVACAYGAVDNLWTDEWGSFRWKNKPRLQLPIPIGLYNVTKLQIKPMQKNTHNDRHSSCTEWVEEFMTDVIYHRDRVKSA